MIFYLYKINGCLVYNVLYVYNVYYTLGCVKIVKKFGIQSYTIFSCSLDQDEFFDAKFFKKISFFSLRK